MPRIARLATAALGAVAFATAFWLPAAADASTNGPAAQSPAALSANAIHLGRASCQEARSAGRTVTRCSQPLTVALTSAEEPSAAAGPPYGSCNDNGKFSNCEYQAHPRVTCGGYNGWVDWYDDEGGTYDVDTYGEVWDTCGDTTYVYLSYKQGIDIHSANDLAGKASDFKTVGVNYDDGTPSEYIGGLSDMKVTVCSNYAYGWHCGTPYPI
jgi:hypothetical protein